MLKWEDFLKKKGVANPSTLDTLQKKYLDPEYDKAFFSSYYKDVTGDVDQQLSAYARDRDAIHTIGLGDGGQGYEIGGREWKGFNDNLAKQKEESQSRVRDLHEDEFNKRKEKIAQVVELFDERLTTARANIDERLRG